MAAEEADLPKYKRQKLSETDSNLLARQWIEVNLGVALTIRVLQFNTLADGECGGSSAYK